ncbi:MAG: SDR family oxidoreductase [Sporolactobacillus sp.]
MLRRILVTGASGGIGQAIARRLAASGFSLYLHYHTSRGQAMALCEQLAASYPKQDFIALQADLSLPEGVSTLCRQLIFTVDGLVYNCGKSDLGLIQDVTPAVLDQAIQLQLKSPFQMIQKLLDPMIRAQFGRIVLMSSIWGLTGAAAETLYSMVKGGQISLVKALAKETASSGITVNAIAPGAVATSMLACYSKTELDDLAESIPIGRLAQPDEVAAAVQFLLSNDASYISGQVISVNGAWYC